MTTPLADAPYCNPFEAALATDAAGNIAGSPLFSDLRRRVAELTAQSPVLRSDLGAMVTGYDEVHTALGDKRLRSGIPELVALQGVTDDDAGAGIANSVLAAEGPRHIRLRRLVTKSLTPRAVEVQRPLIARIANELIDDFDTDDCEFMSAFADHLPIRVISHILGVPDADHTEFARWNQAITWTLSMAVAEHADEIRWGLTNLVEYVTALVQDRTEHPRDDLVTSLITVGREDDKYEDGDVEHMIMAMLFAGHDTTRNQLGLSAWLFATYPDQWQRLRADPSLTVQAVEEVLRFKGAVDAAPRFATEDVELGGYLIPAGTFVTVGLGHSNLDPEVFDDPMAFDICPVRESMNTFGGGRHYCLGANLARAELQEAFTALANRFAVIALTGDPVWRPPIGIYGPDRLPLTFS